MPLRLDLKHNEKIFIGGAVLVNGDSRSAFMVLNDVPILREKDIMTDAEANTPCKRIYLAIQMMYMDPVALDKYQGLFWSLAKDVVSAAPSTSMMIADIGEEILALRYYKALKLGLGLIKYEKELMAHASEPT